MSGIDKRIVEMEFNGGEFEKNVKSSENVLKSFDKTLNETGRTSFGGLNSVIEGVSAKFSILGTIAAGALLKAGSTISTHVGNIIKSLDQVSAGFGEYELKMNSIKVMLAGGRTAEGLPVSLEMVNEQLKQLNEYSDQTIYSFSDMTRNIGKFTNAGVDLETAVKAIKGISNAAALSGANSEEAARAMYNFAQALSAGYVKLIDWKSIENANMATVEFKTQLMDTAVEMGTLEKTADGMYKVLTDGGMEELITPTKMFNQSLEKQWMTSEVLTGTLERYSDVTTDIGARATEAATKVRTFTQLLATTKESIGSGWAMTFELIFGNFEEATKLYTAINDTIAAIIKDSSSARNNLLEGWGDLGGRADVIYGFSNAWKGLYSIVLTVMKAFQHVFPPVTVATLLKISEGFKKLTYYLIPTRTTVFQLHTIFEGFFSVISLALKALGSVFKGVFDGLKYVLSLFSGEKILQFFADIGTFFINLNKSEKTGEVFSKISKGISDGIKWIADSIGLLVNLVKESSIFKEFVRLLGGAFIFLGNAITSLYDSIKKSTFLTDLVADIKVAFANLSSIDTSGLDGTKTKLTNIFTSIKKILGPIGVFLAGIFEKLRTELAKPLTMDSINNFMSIIKGVITGGIGVAIIKFFNTLTGLTKTVGATQSTFNGIFTGIRDVLSSYQKNLDAKKLLIIAGAIAILVGSLLVMTLIDPEKLAMATMTMANLFLQLAIAMKLLDRFGGTSSTGKMIVLASSIFILSLALGSMKDVDESSVAVLTKVMAELILASILLGRAGKNVTVGTTNLIGMAIAANILALAVKIFGSMDPEKLKQGIFAISVLMAEMLIFSVAMQKAGGNAPALLAAGIAMNLMAFAMLKFVGIVAILAQFNPEKLTQGLFGLALMLGVTSIALVALANPKVLLGAAAMLIMANAVMIFVPAIALLGNLPIPVIQTGIIAIGALFAILAIGGYVLAPVVVVIASVAASLFLMGLATFAAGKGMVAFGTGLAIMAAGGIAGIGVMAAAALAFADVLPYLMGKLGEGLVAVVTSIATNSPQLMVSLGKIFDELILLIGTYIPKILAMLYQLVSEVLWMMATRAPEFAAATLLMLVGILVAIGQSIGPIVSAILVLVTNLLNALAEKIPDFAIAAGNFVVALLAGLALQSLLIAQGAFDMVITLINGFSQAIEQNMPILLKAVERLGGAFLKGIKTYFQTSTGVSIVKDLIDGFVEGFKNAVNTVVGAINSFGAAIIAALKAILGISSPSVLTFAMGRNLDAGLVNGIKKDAKNVSGAVDDMGDGAINAFSSVAQSIANAVDSEINSSPIISPVLDLGGITSGASTLSNLLSAGQTYKLAKAKSADDAAAARANQNGSNYSQQSAQSGQSINNQFNLAGAVIRSDEDINKLAEKIFRKQETMMRSRALKPASTY